jgi:putative flavoprotein involved in K+ transport
MDDRRYDVVVVGAGQAGLYFLGLSWQHTRGSALLGFVADDAAFIAGRLAGDPEPSAAKSIARAPEAPGVTEGAF